MPYMMLNVLTETRCRLNANTKTQHKSSTPFPPPPSFFFFSFFSSSAAASCSLFLSSSSFSSFLKSSIYFFRLLLLFLLTLDANFCLLLILLVYLPLGVSFLVPFSRWSLSGKGRTPQGECQRENGEVRAVKSGNGRALEGATRGGAL